MSHIWHCRLSWSPKAIFFVENSMPKVEVESLTNWSCVYRRSRFDLPLKASPSNTNFSVYVGMLV